MGTDTTLRAEPRTPREERAYATNDLNAIRASLMAELEKVRDRLNVGTRDEALRKADEERAAELAQGLERVDRALAAIGAENDTTWVAMRTSHLKEVDEVRAWMREHRRDEASASVR